MMNVYAKSTKNRFIAYEKSIFSRHNAWDSRPHFVIGKEWKRRKEENEKETVWWRREGNGGGGVDNIF